MPLDRPAYPSDVSDEEWAILAPYLTLMRADSEQRDPALRAVFNGLRDIVRTGAAWRFMPHDLPPWAAVYQQMQRWLAAACFLDVAGDLRAVLRMAAAREPEPSAVVLDSRTLRSSPESGASCCRRGVGWSILRQAQDEGSFAWATRCRRLVKDHEGYATTLAGLHRVAFACLMLKHVERAMTGS